jgi:hypothetical protein
MDVDVGTYETSGHGWTREGARRWAIALAFAMAGWSGPIARAGAPTEFEPYFGWGAIQESAGVGGFAFIDGTLYFGSKFGGGQAFQGLRWDSDHATLRCTHVHPTKPQYARLAAGDVLGDGSTKLIVGSEKVVETFDVPSMTRIGAFSLPANLGTLATDDLDGTGADEIAVMFGAQFQVRSMNGTLLWQAVLPSEPYAMCVGQFDSDPAKEILFTNGVMLDGATQSQQFVYPGGFPTGTVEAVDVDGDGIDEVAFRSSDNSIRCVKPITQTTLWTLTTNLPSVIKFGNVDDDAGLELVVGSFQGSTLRVYDVATLTLQGNFPFSSQASNIALCDVIPGGPKEIFFSYTSPIGHRYSLIRGSDMAILDESDPMEGPMHGPFRADFDGDGSDEIAIVSQTTSGVDNGRIALFDAETMLLEATSLPLGGNPAGSVFDAAVADVTGDGTPEILLATHYFGGAAVLGFRYDSAQQTFPLVYQTQPGISGQRFVSVAAADMDGDGKAEVVGGLEATTSGIPPGAEIYVFAGGTGQELWHSAPLSTSINGKTTQVAIANVDGDPALEVVALAYQEAIHVFDANTHWTEAKFTGPFTSVATVASGVLGGDGFGRVHGFAWNGSNWFGLGFKKLVPEYIQGLALAPNGVLAVASSGVLRGFRVRAGQTFLEYTSPNFGLGFGRKFVLAGPQSAPVPISAGISVIAPLK